MKTTKEDFEYFKGRCELWLEVLSLQSWKVDYTHEKVKRGLASCATDFTGHRVTITLSTVWENAKITREALMEAALHEACELLIAPVGALAQARVWDADVYEKENHRVVWTITRLLLTKAERMREE